MKQPAQNEEMMDNNEKTGNGFLEKIFDEIDNRRQEIVDRLTGLIRIPSVVGHEEGNAPFGAGVQKVFDHVLEMAEADGFETVNDDNYGGHILMPGYYLDEDGEIDAASAETLGITGHLDVVPAGDGWKHDPFGAEIEDGRMFGRGTTDDKGPVIACYSAVKILADAGFIPEKNIKIILGLDEETDWVGMEHYFENYPQPDLGFTPDAEFPVIRGEKGILIFDLIKKLGRSPKEGLRLSSMKGGDAANMVPAYARAVVLSDKKEDYARIREIARNFSSPDGCSFKCRGTGKSLEITSHGRSAHGARPESGCNAVSGLMRLLGELNFVNEDINDFIAFYNEHIGDQLNGMGMGIGFTDEPSGSTVFNVGIVEMGKETFRITVNVRYPVTYTEEQIYDGMRPVIDNYDLGVIKGKSEDPIYFEDGHPLIETLMKVYRERTGDEESEPEVIGGGTYARAVNNTVAFGALMPGKEDLAHQAEENIEIDALIELTKIYAQAIYELTKPAEA